MVDGALRSSQHRVVVGHHHAAGAFGAEQLAVDGTDAGHHAVGRKLADGLFQRQPGAGRQHQLTVLHERAFVAQIVDVFARRALLGATALRHGIRTRRIQRDFMARLHFRQIRAHMRQVDLLLAALVVGRHLLFFDVGQRVAFPHRIPHGDRPLR